MNTLLYIPTLNKEKSTTLNHTLNKIIIEYIVSILLVTTPIAKLKKKKLCKNMKLYIHFK